MLQYKDSLENPPLLIVSDIERIRVYTNFTNTVKKVYEITLNDLLKPESLSLLRDAFTNPDALRSPQTTEQVTQQAAAEFGRLAEILRKWGAEPLAAAHFLIRILFCLFAEDVELLPKGIFSRLVTQARRRPALFRPQLTQLFAAMVGGGTFGVEEISNFDGGLFDDATVLDMDSDALDILARVSALDWSAIKPSIFGTLFERSLDPSKRAQLGAHFTGEEDILLVVEPVLMAPLRRRWAEIQAQAHELAGRRDAARGARRTRLEQDLFALLRAFRAELAAIRVLDAACGSGNFLYVALRLLLELEKQVINFAVSLGDSRAIPSVGPEQLYGIEINPYAHELAQVTVWIGYIQWWRDNGFGTPTESILKPLHNILLMDAILAHDEQDNPVEPAWPKADVIIGNPPFLGASKMRSELGDGYLETLFEVYGDRLPACDLVCYWFEKARSLIESGKVKRAGLLATQGIRGGANRVVLDRIKKTGDIFWAQSDRPWILDGAMVHVSMVGFDNGTETDRVLDNKRVQTINSDLTTETDLTAAHALAENLGLSFKGAEPGGPFDIDERLAQRMLGAPINPNGRSNHAVVRPVRNAADLMQGSRNMYTVDFGSMSREEAAQYELPFEYVKQNVYPIRIKNKEQSRSEFWWRYARSRPDMRRAFAGKTRQIATPGVSKHRVFVWLGLEVLCNNLICVVARDDDYFLGVLQSRLHELWSRRLGTQLREAESGQRYTNTTSFETFAFPWPPGQEPKDDPRVLAVADAARDVVAKRDAWLNPPGASEGELKKRTLTNLYNQRPDWLDLAHRKLDDAVLDAYGWPHDIGDDEILARLLALNLERARKA